MGAIRHFNALLRKNFIVWKRNVCCSLCELMCPVFLMLIIVFIRVRITPSAVEPSQDLLGLQTPFYSPFTWDGSQWSNLDQVSIETLDTNLNGFMDANSYTFGYLPKSYEGEVQTYNAAADINGPLAFIPTDCYIKTSFMSPKVTSPVIAYIGSDIPSENNQMTQDLITQLQKLFAYQALANSYTHKIPDLLEFTFKNFTSKEALFAYTSNTDYLIDTVNYPGVCFGFQIDNPTESDYNLELFFNDQALFSGNGTGIPNQSNPAWSPSTTTPNLNAYRFYTKNGFSLLQNFVANNVLKRATGKGDATITLMTTPTPSTDVQLDAFYQVLQSILPLMMLLMYVPILYTTVGKMVKEKENRVRESMKIMGLTDTPYWLSWFAFYTIQNTVIATLAWGTLCINCVEYSSKGQIWLFFWLYGQAVFGQIILIQALFKAAKFAGLVSTVIWFVGSMFNFFLQSAQTPQSEKEGWSIFPQVASTQMVNFMASLENAKVGVSSATAGDAVNNYVWRTGLVIIFLSLICFSLFGLYLDKVMPKDYGKREPVWFLCTPSFWNCGCCKSQRQREVDEDEQDRRTQLRGSAVGDALLADDMEAKHLKPEDYEPVAPEIARQELEDQYLSIEGLKKTYDNGFPAVKNLNMKMYNGQIFALLGQNGAGKSTTIGMLTGLLNKTEGKAVAFNTDLFENMADVRQFMGVCPQHDVLFDQLTPIEHLQLFYELKGGVNDPIKKAQDIQDIIEDVGVAPDKWKQAHSLSGGNKRKLSVAISLIGGSKLVLLDEPTSGMDLSARRGLWEMLKNYKKDRIIILTTHYMDEADILGDRIGIMAKGELMCLGGSLFLKNRFGAGYKITMVKSNKQPNNLIGPYLQEKLGENIIKMSEVSSEITYQIPGEYAPKFIHFFEYFDQDLAQLDIKSYGISITTLEEVFLKINADFQKSLGDDGEFLPEDIGVVGMSKGDMLLDGKQSELIPSSEQEEVEEEQQFYSSTVCSNIGTLLTKKRFPIYRRDKTGLCCEVFVPVLLVLIGCALAQITFLISSKPLVYTPELYPLKQRLLVNSAPLDGTVDTTNTSSTLIGNLPNYTAAFEPTYIDYLGSANENKFDNFYKDVFEQRDVGEIMPYRYGSYGFYSVSEAEQKYMVTNYMNLTSPLAAGLYPQYMYESVLKTATGNKDFTFQVTSAPFPVFEVFLARQEAANFLDFSFMVGLAFALIPTVVISFILKEREEQLKHIQLISGMNLSAYWVANMIADIVKAYIPVIITYVLAAIFSIKIPGLWAIFLLYPLAIIPTTYCYSFLFKGDTVAQISMFFFHFLFGAIGGFIVFLLRAIGSVCAAGDWLRWFFTISPVFSCVYSIIWSTSGSLVIQGRNNPKLDPNSDLAKCGPVPTDLWAFENLGGDAFMLSVNAILGVIILILVELRLCESCRKMTFATLPEPKTDLQLDEDVLEEELRVADMVKQASTASQNRNQLLGQHHGDNEVGKQQQSGQDVIQVSNFRKAYTSAFGTPFLAVERISFGIDYGECFALLGVNGAGKSTTFKCLTGDTYPTSGSVTIAGLDIQTQFEEVRKMIGYCPQKDALFPLMSVEEHVEFFAALKGIPVWKRRELVEATIQNMNLTDHRKKLAGELSGGNKRKLSVANAIIGSPPIILLDEPSAGMDPEARRFMWSVIAKISSQSKKNKSSVILTTHSMEEAEALSTKMGIMVRGGIFRCLGSSQHIKNKFGTGYEIEIKVRKAPYEELQALSKKLGLPEELQQKVNLAQVTATVSSLGQTDCDKMIWSQISEIGLGKDLFLESTQNGGQLKLRNLVEYIFYQQNGFNIITDFGSKFDQVEILEQYGGYYKLRTPKQDKTIGSIFAMIEGKKNDYNISEYAVSQTTLEQIFQNFALTSIDEKASLTFAQNESGQLILLNPDRKSMFVQKRALKQIVPENSQGYTAETPLLENTNFEADNQGIRDTMNSLNDYPPSPPEEESKLPMD